MSVSPVDAELFDWDPSKRLDTGEEDGAVILGVSVGQLVVGLGGRHVPLSPIGVSQTTTLWLGDVPLLLWGPTLTPMDANTPLLAILLAVFFVGDGIACSIPINYIRNDLIRLGVPDNVQRIIPAVKFAAAAGLVIGLWIPLLGLLAAVGGVAYFIIALWYHEQAGDALVQYLPAFALGVWCCLAAGFSYASAI